MKSIHRYASIALMLCALAGSAAAEGKKSKNDEVKTPCAATEQMSQDDTATGQEPVNDKKHDKKNNQKSQAKPVDDGKWLLAIYG